MQYIIITLQYVVKRELPYFIFYHLPLNNIIHITNLLSPPNTKTMTILSIIHPHPLLLGNLIFIILVIMYSQTDNDVILVNVDESCTS